MGAMDKFNIYRRFIQTITADRKSSKDISFRCICSTSISSTSSSSSSSSSYIDLTHNGYTFGLPPPASHKSLQETFTMRTSNDTQHKPISIIFASCYEQQNKDNNKHQEEDDGKHHYSDDNFKMIKPSTSPWKTILEQNPDLVLLMGDTVYPSGLDVGDDDDDCYDDECSNSHLANNNNIRTEQHVNKRTESIIDSLHLSYQALANDSDFRKLYATVPIIATLDDNDYLFLKNKKNNRIKKNMSNSEDKETDECNRRKQKIEEQDIHQKYLNDVAKQMFCDFWQLSKNDSRRLHNRGVYYSTEVLLPSIDEDSNQMNDSITPCETTTPSSIIQFILLDSRYHHNPLFLVNNIRSSNNSYNSNIHTQIQQQQQQQQQHQHKEKSNAQHYNIDQHDMDDYYDDNEKNNNNNNYLGPYVPNNDLNATLLGQSQWNWLQNQLSLGVEKYVSSNNHNNNNANTNSILLRIVVSSIQVIPTGHYWDCWNMVPHERQRLLDLLLPSTTKPNNNSLYCNKIRTIILSGDRHCGGFYLYDTDSNTTSNGTPSHVSTSSNDLATSVDTIALTNKSIIEVTSSSLTHSCPEGILDNEYDATRLGDLLCGVNNFGRIVVSINSSNDQKSSIHQQTPKFSIGRQNSRLDDCNDTPSSDQVSSTSTTDDDNNKLKDCPTNEIQMRFELLNASNGAVLRAINVAS